MKKFDLVIKGKYILPMNESLEIIKNGFVGIQDDEIIEVGLLNDLVDYETKEEIFLENSIVMPGLINTHTHVAMSLFRGLADDLPLQEWWEKHMFPAEAKNVNPNFVKLSSQLGCLEMLKSGVVCFNDMYFFEEETAKVASEIGMRSIIGEAILNFPTASCETPDKTIEKTLDLIEKFKDDNLVNVSFVPHAIYTLDQKYLEKVRDLASEHNKQIHIHISETKKEVDDCQNQHDMSPVEYLDSFGFLGENVVAAHSVWLSDNDLDIYQKRGVKVSYNPISNMKLASGIARAQDILDKNIIIGFASDGAASNNTQDLFSEMRVVALVHKVNNLDPTVLNAKEVVKMSTINAAKVLNKDKEIGSLEVGKKADIVTIDLNKPHLAPIYDPYSHLVYATEAQDVNDVVVNGKILMRNREVKTMNEKDILQKVNKFKIKK